MSHQMRVKTQVKNLLVLKQVLDDLGYTYTENGALHDYRDGGIGNVDLLVRVGNHANRIGFQLDQSVGSYDLVGDFYQVGVSEDNFRKAVMKGYTSKQVKALLAKKRYTVYKEEVQTNGAVKMLARSMAA